MSIVQFIIGLAVIFLLTQVVCRDRKHIKIRYIVQVLAIELIVAYCLLRSTIGLNIVNHITHAFNILLSYANEGTDFVFGGLRNGHDFSFFLQVLMPIIYISALIGILQHIKLLPLIIKTIGWLLSKINGMGKIESFNAISSMIVGQSENFISYKDIIHTFSEKRMYTLSATAMSTVSMSIVGSYMQLLKPQYVVAALFINLFSTFVILLLINPYDLTNQEDQLVSSHHHEKASFFEILSEYILTGFKIAIIIAAMLMGFIALISTINHLFEAILGVSFQDVMGYVFYPFAWLLAIPHADLHTASSIMAIKLVTNEFVAMIDLKAKMATLSPYSTAVLSVFLVSFANFGSIGIIAGAVKGLNEKQGNIVSRFGLRLVYGSTLVSLLSALICGFLFH